MGAIILALGRVLRQRVKGCLSAGQLRRTLLIVVMFEKAVYASLKASKTNHEGSQRKVLQVTHSQRLMMFGNSTEGSG